MSNTHKELENQSRILAIETGLSAMLKNNPSNELLTELEKVIDSFNTTEGDQGQVHEETKIPHQVEGGVETIQFKPKAYTWYGKIPLIGGTTDWFGYKSPITSGPESGLKQLANIPIKPYETPLRSPSQLQRTAIGVIAPGVKSISYFTQMNEDTIGSVVEGVVGAGGMHRDAYILESIDYGQKASETIQLIEKGYAWLDPLRNQHLIVPTTYLPKINDAARQMIEDVFEIVPYELSRNYDTSGVNADLLKLLKHGEVEMRTSPGLVMDKQFWLQHTLLIANVLGSLFESDDVWPPSNRPVIVFAELGNGANDQYHHALDLIEAISIIRNKPVRSWATSQVTTEAMHNHIPSLIVIDPRTCERRHLNNIENVKVIDNTGNTSHGSPELIASIDQLVKDYIRGTTNLDEVRKGYRTALK